MLPVVCLNVNVIASIQLIGCFGASTVMGLWTIVVMFEEGWEIRLSP